MKENGFKLTKERSRRYSAKTIADADYADNIVLLANAPAEAEILLHSLERAAAGIGLHVKGRTIRDVALKTCWKQWTIGRSGEKRSEISVLMARHDDDDDV